MMLSLREDWLMHMCILKRQIARFVFTDTHQKATCCDEIGLRAQYKDTILG